MKYQLSTIKRYDDVLTIWGGRDRKDNGDMSKNGNKIRKKNKR